VFVELRSRHDGQNNGKLSLSMDEGARLLGLGKSTIARAFSELAEKGFLVLVKKGRWYGRLAHEWATTDRPLNGCIPTNAWKYWTSKKAGAPSVPIWHDKSEVGSPTGHNFG